MEFLGPLAVVALLIVLVVWPLTAGRRYVRGRRDAAFSQKARETWMGSTGGSAGMGGYVPHDPLPPSPRDALRSPPDDEHS